MVMLLVSAMRFMTEPSWAEPACGRIKAAVETARTSASDRFVFLPSCTFGFARLDNSHRFTLSPIAVARFSPAVRSAGSSAHATMAQPIRRVIRIVISLSLLPSIRFWYGLMLEKFRGVAEFSVRYAL